MSWFGGDKTADPAIDPKTGKRRAPPILPPPVRDPSQPVGVFQRLADRARERANARDTAIARVDPNAPESPTLAGTPAPPPATNLAGSTSVLSAQSAAERQRKRALAGTSLATGTPRRGPAATLKPRTLTGYS